MRFCVQCGTELKENSKFCTACGLSVEQPKSQRSNSVKKKEHEKQHVVDPVGENNEIAEHQKEEKKIMPEQSGATEKSVKEPMKQSTKIILISAVSIIVLLFGMHKWLEKHFDPMNDLVALEEAILSGDVQQFYKLIDIYEDAILDKEGYLTY